MFILYTCSVILLLGNIPIYMNPFILEVQIFEFVHEIYVCDQQIYGASFFFFFFLRGKEGADMEEGKKINQLLLSEEGNKIWLHAFWFFTLSSISFSVGLVGKLVPSSIFLKPLSSSFLLFNE